MSKSNESLKTILVAGVLCFICSILVSITVVNLKPKQLKNADVDYKKNILVAAGLVETTANAEEIQSTFDTLQIVVVDLATGNKVDMKADDFNEDKAEKIVIPSAEDIGGLVERTKYAKVFLKKDDQGAVQTIILKVVGKGLWSTMKGFIALADDANTIKGFAYYSQGETPGLGAEVDNPKWKSQWIGKKVYDDAGAVKFAVAKAQATGDYQVDGLSGATITANGVTNSMKYWFGGNAYQSFLTKLKAGEF